MVAARPQQYAPFTEREYLALEMLADTKHEYSGGVVVDMAGAEIAHNRVVTNLSAALVQAIGDGPCEVLSSDQRVKIESSSEYYYPDLIMVCDKPRIVEPRPRSLINPSAIFEVLSPSTQSYDEGIKLEAYKAIPSLREVVLVDSTGRRIIHHRRVDDQWHADILRADDTLVLANGIEIAVARIYRRVFDEPELG